MISEKDLGVLLGHARRADPDPAFVARLEARLARPRPRRWIPLAAAAAVLLVAVLALRPRGSSLVLSLPASLSSGYYDPLHPAGISGRLQHAAWAVGGRIAKQDLVEEVVDGHTHQSVRAVLDPAEIYLTPREGAPLPKAWGGCQGTGCNKPPQIEAGTWILVLCEEDGGLPSRVEFEEMITVLPDLAACRALADRIRGVKAKDPALGPVLRKELEKGGGALPWSAPRDLIADLAWVGGPAEAAALRVWARGAKDAVLRKAANEAADRMARMETPQGIRLP